MRKSLLLTALLAGVAVAGQSLAAVTVQGAWLRATPPGVDVGAGYGTLRNDGDQPRQIVRVETGAADSAMIHSMSQDKGMMQMREAGALAVPAHGSVALTPGQGYHLMLMGLRQPLAAGQSVPVTFVLDDGSRLQVDFPVRAAAP
ncbi:copper chaperone PCu(A)C [Solimonas soli]|uniref:copper chaperone PCu(A)C n=1 Tax=Solimonas soli TaxID=413479 RepID=UPI00048605C0|nr:copper chaperone PCu(A)C [Solimonas soli]